jgi:hypothetical protein
MDSACAASPLRRRRFQHCSIISAPGTVTCNDEGEPRRHLAGRIAAFKVQLGREDRALPRPGGRKIDKRAFKARCSQAWEVAKATL